MKKASPKINGKYGFALLYSKSVVSHMKLKKNTIKLHEREYRGDFYATAVHVYQKGFNLQQSTGFG